jgi:hypothetical protein
MTHQEKVQFVWLDADVYNNENEQLLNKMREINNESMEFTEQDECLRFLRRGAAHPRRSIFIVSGKLGEKVVSKIHEHENIVSIYVYCGWREKHEKWAKQYEKVGYHS